MTTFRALSDVTTSYSTLQAGDLLFVERGGAAGKTTWSQFQALDMTLSGTVNITGTFQVAGTAFDAATLGLLTGMSKSGTDASFITGAAGTDGNLAVWNADGDLVDGPDLGTSANNVPQLDGSGRYPAADGSQITNVIGATSLTFREKIEPTSDTSTVTFTTDLTSYSVLEVEGMLSFTTGAGDPEVTIQVRESGGAWREIADTGSMATSVAISMFFRIRNLQNGDGTVTVRISGQSSTTNQQIDRSDNSRAFEREPRHLDGYHSYAENVAELRVVASVQSFAQSTANNRGFLMLYAD